MSTTGVGAVQETNFLDPLDDRVRWYGHRSLERAGQFVTPWRVPHWDTDLYFPIGGTGRAAMTSGVRFSFVTDSRSATFEYATTPPTYDTDPPELPVLDVLIDNTLWRTVQLEKKTERASFTVDGLPVDTKLVELWLPTYHQMRLGPIQVEAGSHVERDPRTAPTWTHFGCSISQGRGSASPSRMFLADMARRMSVDLMSVSFGGTCHLQPMFARLVAGIPSRLITAHVGSNVYYYGSLNRETLEGAVLGFVKLIRDRQPDTPVVIVSPTLAPAWERKPGPSKLTHRRVRDQIHNAMQWLLDRGDKRLFYLDGLELFGPDDAEHFLEPPDREQIHFAPNGHQLVADRWLTWLRERGLVPKAEAL